MINIIFPPQFEPFQPYLSPFYLKGILNKYEIPSKVLDLNVDFYNWLFKRKLNSNEKSLRFLNNNIGESVNKLRRSPADLLQYRYNINIVDRFLNHISEKDGIKIGLTYLKITERYNSDSVLKLINKQSVLSEYFENRFDYFFSSENPSIILISLVVLDQIPATILLSKLIKENYSKSKIAIGGPLISRLEVQLKNISWLRNYIDYIVPGEAYRTLPQIIGMDKIIYDHVSPDFSDCKWDEYLSFTRTMPYLISHGCKWGKCTFCSHHLSYDGYRTSKNLDVIKDLEKLTKKYQINYVTFSDEYLTPRQLDDLSTQLVNKKQTFKWLTFVRPEKKFGDHIFTSKLYVAGCRLLMFGFESGSQQILKFMRKGSSVSNFSPILRSCKKSNIAVRIDFMVGFPGENIKHIKETYRFIKDNRSLLDTPFSSYSVAIFELRDKIPITFELEKMNLIQKDKLRGDLDDLYEYEEIGGLTEEEKIFWREKLISLFKLNFDNEMITPMNKTDQLIYKGLYDEEKIKLPYIINIDQLKKNRLSLKFIKGTNIKINGNIIIHNFANGGILQINKNIISIINKLNYGGELTKIYKEQSILDKILFQKVINYFYRNDYLNVN